MINVTLHLYLYLVFSCICSSDYVRKASFNGSSNFASRSNGNAAVSQILYCVFRCTWHIFLSWNKRTMGWPEVPNGACSVPSWQPEGCPALSFSRHTLHLLKLAPYGHFRLSPCLLMALKAHIRTRWYFIVFSGSTGCFCLNYLPLYHLLSAFHNSSDGRAICIYHHLEPAALLTPLGFQTSAAFSVQFNNAADCISVLNLPVDSCTYQMWWA